MKLTTKDLITEVSLYVALYSKRKKLSQPREVRYFTHKENVKDILSVYFRLLAIESLLKAFKLDKKCSKQRTEHERWASSGWDNQSELDFFLQGYFLENEIFRIKVTEKVRSLLHELMIDSEHKRMIDSARIKPNQVFKGLMEFRIKMDAALVSRYVNYEGFSYSLAFIQSFKHTHLKDSMDKTNNLLAELVDIEGLSFSIDELINDFGYPNVDFKKLDTDWFLKEYDDF